MSKTLAEVVAEEVRAMMGRRRMTQAALARAINRSDTYVWRRLTGETAFDVTELEHVAKALDVPIDQLLRTPERAA